MGYPTRIHRVRLSIGSAREFEIEKLVGPVHALVLRAQDGGGEDHGVIESAQIRRTVDAEMGRFRRSVPVTFLDQHLRDVQLDFIPAARILGMLLDHLFVKPDRVVPLAGLGRVLRLLEKIIDRVGRAPCERNDAAAENENESKPFHCVGSGGGAGGG